MSDAERRSRAADRSGRMVLRKSSLRRDEEDLSPVAGPEAVALVHQLTVESWSIAGREVPTYTRARTPYQFVPRA